MGWSGGQKSWFIDIPTKIWERIVNHVSDNVRADKIRYNNKIKNKQDKINQESHQNDCRL